MDYQAPIPESSFNKRIGFNTGGEIIVEKNKQEAINEGFPSYRDEKGNDINIVKRRRK